MCGEGAPAVCTVLWVNGSKRAGGSPLRGERGRPSLSRAQEGAPAGLGLATRLPGADRGGVLRPRGSVGSRAAGCAQRGCQADVEAQGTGAW